MSSAIVTAAIAALQAAGIPAEAAYPGKAYPRITTPVAAVHIHSAQPGQRKMVLEIFILSPKDQGGGAGEAQALMAMAALTAIGGDCTQSGCSYDGLLKSYSTRILAEFTTGIGEDDGGAGFAVYLDDVALEYAVEVTSEACQDAQMIYTMGQDLPDGINRGPVSWHLTVTEKIPLGAAEILPPEGECRLRVTRGGGWESFSGCVWTQIRRNYCPGVLTRTLVGMAMAREGA